MAKKKNGVVFCKEHGCLFTAKDYKQHFTVWHEFKTVEKPFKKSKFYVSKEWKELRRLVLKVLPNKCGWCGRAKTLNVDHVLPIKKYPALRLDLENLQILCSRCNKRKANHVKNWDSRTEQQKQDLRIAKANNDQNQNRPNQTGVNCYRVPELAGRGR